MHTLAKFLIFIGGKLWHSSNSHDFFWRCIQSWQMPPWVDVSLLFHGVRERCQLMDIAILFYGASSGSWTSESIASMLAIYPIGMVGNFVCTALSSYWLNNCSTCNREVPRTWILAESWMMVMVMMVIMSDDDGVDNDDIDGYDDSDGLRN